MEHEAATITAGTLTGDDYQITAAGQLDEDANCITFTVKLVRLSASDNGSSADESYKVRRRGCEGLRTRVQSHISRVWQNIARASCTAVLPILPGLYFNLHLHQVLHFLLLLTASSRFLLFHMMCITTRSRASRQRWRINSASA